MYLPSIPAGSFVVLDTETSGLYVDGNWSTQPSKCQPPARVASAGIACRLNDGSLFVDAWPFDQGTYRGKPGRWNYELNDFDILDYPCLQCGQQPDGSSHTRKSKPCTYIADRRHEQINLGRHEWLTLCEWLSDKSIVLANAKYDTHIMEKGLRKHEGTGLDILPLVGWDVLLMAGVSEPHKQTSLDAVSRRLLRSDDDSDEGAYQGGKDTGTLDAALKALPPGLRKRYDLISWADMRDYLFGDCKATFLTFEEQRRRAHDGELDYMDMPVFEEQMRYSVVLTKMERRGVGFKAEDMRMWATRIESEVLDMQKTLPFDPPTVNEGKKYFFDDLQGPQLKPFKHTNTCKHCRYNMATGKYPRGKDAEAKARTCAHEPSASLDAESVAALANAGNAVAETFAGIEARKSALGKWLSRWPHLVGTDGRLRTTFRQMKIESDHSNQKSGGAISGRLSAERVQMQGVPQDEKLTFEMPPIKTFFAAKEGHQLWEIDISNAELFIAAWATWCKNLADTLNSGKNVHDMNTRAIFGIEKDNPEWNQKRHLCKIGVFSDFYGSGVDTMLHQFEAGLRKKFSRQTVMDFKANLKAAYPEIKIEAKKAERQVDKGQGGCGYIRLRNGRRRVFGWGERTYKALNSIMQGNVSVGVTHWMLRVEEKHPGILVNCVHDSIWLEVSSERAEEVVKDCIQMGKDVFESMFSEPEMPLNYRFDAKRIA